jgi:hypothetical protein
MDIVFYVRNEDDEYYRRSNKTSFVIPEDNTVWSSPPIRPE